MKLGDAAVSRNANKDPLPPPRRLGIQLQSDGVKADITKLSTERKKEKRISHANTKEKMLVCREKKKAPRKESKKNKKNKTGRSSQY